MIKKIFLSLTLVLSSVVAFAQQPEAKMPLALYQSIVGNIKTIVEEEFKDATFEKLTFKKGQTVKKFKDLSQLEKDVYMLEKAKSFSLYIREFEKKCCTDLLEYNPKDQKEGLPTKEDLIKIIDALQQIKKDQTKESIVFAEQVIERNKLSGQEANKLLKEIHEINDSIYKNAP